jgi:hypothetical protein
MTVTSETTSGGTLDISGRFPAAPGTVTILDGNTTVPLTVVSWGTSDVVVSLPASGTGSKGVVVMTDALDAESNATQLTQWQGTGTYTEGDAVDALSGQSGSGDGGYLMDFSFTFRAEGDAGNVFCPGFGFFGPAVGTCTPIRPTAACAATRPPSRRRRALAPLPVFPARGRADSRQATFRAGTEMSARGASEAGSTTTSIV